MKQEDLKLLTESNYDKRKLPILIFTKDYSVKDTSLFIKGEEYTPYMYNYSRMINMFKAGIIEVDHAATEYEKQDRMIKRNIGCLNKCIIIIAIFCAIWFVLLISGCKSSLTLKVDYCNGKSEIKKVKARKGICLINFKEDTSVWYLATKSNRILIDSVCDFEVLKVEK